MKPDDVGAELRECTRNDPASQSAISTLEQAIGIRLPVEYRELLQLSNGLEGFVSDTHYLVLWPIEQVAELNDGYRVSEFAPGLLLFGSNGGDTGYGFDTRTEELPIVEVPFVGMSLEQAKQLGTTFAAFLAHLRAD